MTAIELLSINAVVIGGCSWLVYALTHGRDGLTARQREIKKREISGEIK